MGGYAQRQHAEDEHTTLPLLLGELLLYLFKDQAKLCLKIQELRFLVLNGHSKRLAVSGS